MRTVWVVFESQAAPRIKGKQNSKHYRRWTGNSTLASSSHISLNMSKRQRKRSTCFKPAGQPDSKLAKVVTVTADQQGGRGGGGGECSNLVCTLYSEMMSV